MSFINLHSCILKIAGVSFEVFDLHKLYYELINSAKGKVKLIYHLIDPFNNEKLWTAASSRGILSKKLFPKNSYYSQKNICGKVPFWSKSDFNVGVFS